MNLDWIVGQAAGLIVLVIYLKWVKRKIASGYKYEYICPKCNGTDYFMSNRNVMKGIGGIWGNRGGTKQFPVCRQCDEIMDARGTLISTSSKDSRIFYMVVVVLLSLYLLRFFWG